MGPVGFYSLWAKDLFGDVPWNVYSLLSHRGDRGLTHVPHVYLYSSAALKSLGSDVEEAARVVGANPLQVALNVSLPMTMPALLYAAVLVFFLGFELFGLPLVLGDPEGHLVLATYLYKLTNKLGTPSYHLMAAVAVCSSRSRFRWCSCSAGSSRRPANTCRSRARRRGRKCCRWADGSGSRCWWSPCGWRSPSSCPISGIALRAFVEQWGEGIKLADVLTLANFRQVFDQSDQVRAVVNTFLIGTARRGVGRRLLCRHRPRRSPPARGSGQGPRLPGADSARWSRACLRAWRSSGCFCSCRD
jgi:iron(III) transport system permease protein